jgi:hypothetical protein
MAATTPTPDSSQNSPPTRRVLWKWSAAVTAIALLWFGWRCGLGLIKGRKDAEVAVQHFHELLNSGEYDQIYREGTDGLRGEDYKHGEVLKYFRGVHTKLGKTESANLQNLNITTNTEGTYLVSVYRTTFENGTALETFTWLKSGTGLQLHGYNIQSDAFILN